MFGFIQLMIILFIVFLLIQGISQWIRNNNSPILSQRATVIGKRKQTSYNQNDGFITEDTDYYVTFLLEDGEKRKFRVSRRVYRELEEGTQGTLTYQGTRYKGFEDSLN